MFKGSCRKLFTHILEGLFEKWNTAVNENYIDIGANDDAQSTTNNPDHSSTSDYSGGEIGVYVKGSFDLNTSEGKWFECLDSRILALVSFEVVRLRGEVLMAYTTRTNC